MLFMQILPSFPYISFDRQIHIAPAAMYPQLKRLALKLDSIIVFYGELSHVRHPVRETHGPLEIELDHVTLLFEMDVIIDFMADPERPFDRAVAVTYSRIIDRVRNGTRMIIILACVYKVLFERQALISQDVHPVSYNDLNTDNIALSHNIHCYSPYM